MSDMDPIMTAVLLSWVEIKSVCETLVKYPDNDDEKAVAEHILAIMETHMREAKPGSRPPARTIREPGPEVYCGRGPCCLPRNHEGKCRT